MSYRLSASQSFSAYDAALTTTPDQRRRLVNYTPAQIRAKAIEAITDEKDDVPPIALKEQHAFKVFTTIFATLIVTLPIAGIMYAIGQIQYHRELAKAQAIITEIQRVVRELDAIELQASEQNNTIGAFIEAYEADDEHDTWMEATTPNVSRRPSVAEEPAYIARFESVEDLTVEPDANTPYTYNV